MFDFPTSNVFFIFTHDTFFSDPAKGWPRIKPSRWTMRCKSQHVKSYFDANERNEATFFEVESDIQKGNMIFPLRPFSKTLFQKMSFRWFFLSVVYLPLGPFSLWCRNQMQIGFELSFLVWGHPCLKTIKIIFFFFSMNFESTMIIMALLCQFPIESRYFTLNIQWHFL